MKNVGEITRTVIDLNRTAIIDTGKSPHQKLTFHELNLISNGVAAFLIARHFKEKSKVAIIAENSAEFIIAYYGILKAGMIAVFINPKLPQKQIHQVLQDSNCALIFCDQNVESSLPASFERIVIESEFKNFQRQDSFPNLDLQENDVAVVVFTSGSTSEPVGVELLHKRLLWRIEQSVKSVSVDIQKSGFMSFVLAPLFHMNGFFSSQSILASGGTIVIQPRFDCGSFVENLIQYKVVFLTGVPTMMAMLMAYLKENRSDAVFPLVKGIMLGSAPLSESLLKEIKVHFPNVDYVRNNYGLTEVGPNLFGDHPQKIPTPELSVGYPRPEIEYKLVNDVLYVKSPSMMRGYSKRDEKLKARLTSDGFFNTKDIFRVDDKGFYYFVSRSDDMIVCGGHNVYLSNIDRILESHEAVEQAVTISLEDQIKGQKPYAFVKLKGNFLATAEELKAHLLEKMPPYAVPRKIWKIHKLPMGTTGKIDRKYLQNTAFDLLERPDQISNDGISDF